MRLEQASIKLKWRCPFVGVFWYRDPINYRAPFAPQPLPFWWWHIYLCIIPCLPFVLIFRTARKPATGGKATLHRLHEQQ